MKTFRLPLVAAVLLLAPSAFAQEITPEPADDSLLMPADLVDEPLDDAATAAEETAEPETPADIEVERRTYRQFWLDEIDRIMEMDLYGVTAQLPAGYLKMKWDYGWMNANRRLDSNGNRGPVLSPLQFGDGEDLWLDVALEVSGGGHGHTFQFSYGITDPLDYYIEIPFTAMNLSIDPEVRPINEAGDRLGGPLPAILGEDPQTYDESAFLYRTFPQVGRPAPATGYHGDWLIGDINTGFSWNYFRQGRFSAALTPRIYLPTGHIPGPESNLTYATGPQPEIGIGGWGTSTTAGWDLKLYEAGIWSSAVLSTDMTVGYFFRQQRDYPTNFVRPVEGAETLDPSAFPDLSQLEGSFTYIPGWNMSWTAQFNISFTLLNLGLAYGTQWSEEPKLIADPDFVSMVEGLELLGAQRRNEFQIGLSLPLLPLYVPANIGIVRRIMVGGRDTLAFDDFWQLTVEGFVPLYLLWDRDGER